MSLRRGKGEGYFEQTPGGLRLVVEENGRRMKGPVRTSQRLARAAWVEKFQTPRLKANEAASVPLRRLISELLTENSDHPFAEAMRLRWAGSTYDGNVTRLRALAKTSLGSRTLLSITELDLYRARPELGPSPRTRRNRLEMLTWLGKMAGVSLPALPREQEDPADSVIVMPGDADQLFALARSDRERLIFGVLYLCGLRASELAGLQRKDFNGQELHVRRVATTRRGSVVEVSNRTKTRESRIVPVPRKWLRELLSQSPDGYIIHPPGDPASPVTAKAISGAISRRVKGTKFEGLTPQGLRRSTATAYAISGVPLVVAAANMGHDSEMLRKVYARYNDTARMDAAMQAFGAE